MFLTLCLSTSTWAGQTYIAAKDIQTRFGGGTVGPVEGSSSGTVYNGWIQQSYVTNAGNCTGGDGAKTTCQVPADSATGNCPSGYLKTMVHRPKSGSSGSSNFPVCALVGNTLFSSSFSRWSTGGGNTAKDPTSAGTSKNNLLK